MTLQLLYILLQSSIPAKDAPTMTTTFSV